VRLSDYNYELPEGLIAKYPPEVRGGSRLLVLERETGALIDSWYRDLAEFLRPGDLLVLNETKVMKARMFFLDEQDREHEIVLLEKHGDIGGAGAGKMVLYRGRLREGEVLRLRECPDTQIAITEVIEGGIAKINRDLTEVAAGYGRTPLPPYLRREAEKSDEERYQTEFARHLGSAAAPTASLNLTKEILGAVEAKGVKVVKLTLHVGLGTFLPIRTDDLTAHKMHAEYYEISAEAERALEGARDKGGRIVAVGTTVVRALESYASSGKARGETEIFIYPGYDFKLVDAMLTNFHAPKSTVLMMAAAFAGWDNLEKAYEHAKREEYAFLSYGDSMLVY